MTGKGRHHEGLEGNWLEGLPFRRSEWCREYERCTHKNRGKGCAFARAQAEMDAVDTERQRFVQKRMDARGWAWLAYDLRNGFDLDGTPNFGPAYDA
eukprot:14783769-Heterocapsa_arctica.AAC.1